MRRTDGKTGICELAAALVSSAGQNDSSFAGDDDAGDPPIGGDAVRTLYEFLNCGWFKRGSIAVGSLRAPTAHAHKDGGPCWCGILKAGPRSPVRRLPVASQHTPADRA